jgi:hypothetical protein
VTLMARIPAIFVLILCGSFQLGHLSGAGRPGSARVPVAQPARMLSIGEVWTANTRTPGLSDIGRGKGIVFNPDLSEPGNREFYRALGFAYFEDPDWHLVLAQIKTYNKSHPENRIEVLLIQSHGTNGEALKLQKGDQPDAPRSYISPAALQERLEGTGVRMCLLAACNAGRLFRPENYAKVRAEEGNRLFGPATLGIINASSAFDPSRTSVMLGRRVESHIEVINECHVSELSPAARRELARSGRTGIKAATRIAVPEMLIQLLLQDQGLHLVSFGFEVQRSRAETRDNDRERLIARFLGFINRIAAQEHLQEQRMTN